MEDVRSHTLEVQPRTEQSLSLQESEGIPPVVLEPTVPSYARNEERYMEVILMRHSERADDDPDCHEAIGDRVWDPPLTRNGFKQASQTAQEHLRNLWTEKTDTVQRKHIGTIVSSPYLRCLQTASQLRSSIGINTKVKVDNGLGEMYNKATLLRNTIPEGERDENSRYPIAAPPLLSAQEVEALLPQQVDLDTPSPGKQSVFLKSGSNLRDIILINSLTRIMQLGCQSGANAYSPRAIPAFGMPSVE